MSREYFSMICAAFVAGHLVAARSFTATALAQTRAQAQTPTRLEQLNDDLRGLVSRVSPSVVQILATSYAGLSTEGVATGAVLAQQRAGGSGVILDPDGFIVTNAHVVAAARSVRVVLTPPPASSDRSIVRPPGRALEATIVGVDEETDLAVLKVDARGLPALQLGDSDDLRQGHVVFAFGSPLGLDNSVTMGIVSAVGRQRVADDPMVYLQTDAPINPGSSGGPLVDTAARVVGINTFILSQSGGNQGLGFAAPSNIVRNVFDQLKTTGHVRRGTLGVIAQTITSPMAAGLGLKREGGVILADVAPGGPGAVAGLLPGDIIASLDGKPMENARQFEVNLYRRRVGDVATIEYERGGEVKRTSAAVRERPNDPERFATLAHPDRNLVPRLGILGIEIDRSLAARLPQLRVKGGVLVAARAANAAAAEGGLLPGDLIAAVNNAPVASLSELRALLDKVAAGGPCVLHVQRGEILTYVVLTLD
jgi:serine protease Do